MIGSVPVTRRRRRGRAPGPRRARPRRAAGRCAWRRRCGVRGAGERAASEAQIRTAGTSVVHGNHDVNTRTSFAGCARDDAIRRVRRARTEPSFELAPYWTLRRYARIRPRQHRDDASRADDAARAEPGEPVARAARRALRRGARGARGRCSSRSCAASAPLAEPHLRGGRSRSAGRSPRPASSICTSAAARTRSRWPTSRSSSGSLFASGDGFLVGALLGAGVAYAFRRLPPIKLGFNLAQLALAVCVAFVIVRAIAGDADAIEPRDVDRAVRRHARRRAR